MFLCFNFLIPSLLPSTFTLLPLKQRFPSLNPSLLPGALGTYSTFYCDSVIVPPASTQLYSLSLVILFPSFPSFSLLTVPFVSSQFPSSLLLTVLSFFPIYLIYFLFSFLLNISPFDSLFNSHIFQFMYP